MDLMLINIRRRTLLIVIYACVLHLQGLTSIIPGKSPLPPSHLLPLRLQNFQFSQAGADDSEQKDDNDI